MQSENISGKKYTRLLVIARVGSNKGHSLWQCICDCGNKKIVPKYNLTGGRVKSCGCLQKEGRTTHGHTKYGKQSATYKTWQGMLNRCFNNTHTNFAIYGGRGITVCDRWRNSFENFLTDMGERPDGKTLDRCDNYKGYSLDNCRWATICEQVINRRKLKTNKSGYSGVWKERHKWASCICIKGKTIRLGNYFNIEDAIKARNEYILKNNLSYPLQEFKQSNAV